MKGLSGKSIAKAIGRETGHASVCRVIRQLVAAGVLLSRRTGKRTRNPNGGEVKQQWWSKTGRRYCLHGHYMSKRNTVTHPDTGQVHCRKCRRAYNTAYQHLRRSGFLDGEKTMTEAVFFAVERTITGGEQASIYHDRMPTRLTGKNAKRDGLIYAVRVDTLPHAEKWLAMSLDQLYEAFCKARSGQIPLPQNIATPSGSAKPAERKMGHRETIAARPGSDLPMEPWPTVEELDRRAEKRDAGA